MLSALLEFVQVVKEACSLGNIYMCIYYGVYMVIIRKTRVGLELLVYLIIIPGKDM